VCVCVYVEGEGGRKEEVYVSEVVQDWEMFITDRPCFQRKKSSLTQRPELSPIGWIKVSFL
jgi:hypothetical protein